MARSSIINFLQLQQASVDHGLAYVYFSYKDNEIQTPLPLYQRASSGYIITPRPDHRTAQVCLDHQASLRQLLDGQVTNDATHTMPDDAKQKVTDNTRHEVVESSLYSTTRRTLDVSPSPQESSPKGRWWQRPKNRSRKRQYQRRDMQSIYCTSCVLDTKPNG